MARDEKMRIDGCPSHWEQGTDHQQRQVIIAWLRRLTEASEPDGQCSGKTVSGGEAAMTKRNEKTSAPVASIAGKWLAKDMKFERMCDLDGNRIGRTKFTMLSEGEWREIKSVLASAATQAPDEAEVDRLRKRLEMTHFWQYDKKRKRMVRRKVNPGDYIPDGIECRDETIRMQDQYIKELVGRLKALQPKRRAK